MRLGWAVLLLTATAVTLGSADGDVLRPEDCQGEGEFADCSTDPRAFPEQLEWRGKRFRLNQSYPAELKHTEQPWLAHDPFGQLDAGRRWEESRAYLDAVLNHVLEGNIRALDGTPDFAADPNRWFHAPWMHPDCQGREALRGLTLERRSEPGELAVGSPESDNWAVGMYNAPGGYFIGQVWRDYKSSDVPLLERLAGDPVIQAGFPQGTVALKLLFTTATAEQVPYLQRSPQWQALI